MSSNNTLLLLDTPRDFPVKDREAVCSVHVSFQGLAADLVGYGRVPIFGPFCYSLDPVNRALWRQAEAGDTHCIRDLSYNYHDGSYQYPVPGSDFTKHVEQFKTLLAEDLVLDRTPIVYLAGDGQSYNPDGGTYGYPWLMANLPRLMAQFCDPSLGGFDASRYCLFVLGFELISYGGWSPDNFESATLLLRSLIPDGYIASHIGTYTWWGDGSGGTRGPIGDWASPAGQAIDVCFDEGDAPFVDARTGKPLFNENWDGWEQRAAAHLGPAAQHIQPKNRVVYEWPQPPAQQTPRGRRYAVALELDEYRWVRNEVPLNEIDQERVCLADIGFELIG